MQDTLDDGAENIVSTVPSEVRSSKSKMPASQHAVRTPSRTAMLKTDNAHRVSGPRDHFHPERPHLVCRLTRSPGSTHDSAPSRVVIRLNLQLVPPRPKHDALVSDTTCSCLLYTSDAADE